MRSRAVLIGVIAVLLIAVTFAVVVRPNPGRTTTDALVVSGGVPPDPPPPVPLPAAGPQLKADTWGAAGRYRSWANRLSSKVSIEPRALAAYALGETYGSCGLSWVTLAAIGSVESAHGRFNGATLAADGTSSPAIIGPPLDGRPGVQAIADTDGGQYDGDTRWDRAVGPMQFLPSTWRRWAVDADNDGVARPHDLDDAAATAATYLCASTQTMTTATGWWTAITTYNHSAEYAHNVLTHSNQYAQTSLN
ncbi:lytic murein transglycosylase [Kribbella sp. NPDC051718]|uniref:lytic murein transglycosylase n=1 Tax=Kribbella sp. NPDC051718 TaxID=3155168 RepID=UPI003447FBC5